MLRIDHISKTFNPGTVNEKTALRGLSLHLKPGDFASIIGSNGAGKSTLLGAIAGSFIVDSGSIALDGRDITFTPDHRRSVVIGRLFQDPLRGTAPSMTREENLALAYLRSTKERLSRFSCISRTSLSLLLSFVFLLPLLLCSLASRIARSRSEVSIRSACTSACFCFVSPIMSRSISPLGYNVILPSPPLSLR